MNTQSQMSTAPIRIPQSAVRIRSCYSRPEVSGEPIIPIQDLRAQYESIRSEIAMALAEVLERQDFILGREVSQLEEQVARLCGTRCAVTCASGSDALLLALMALNIRPGDEVLVPSFTFFATAGSVARLGARPVFADIEPASFNISPESVGRLTAGHPGLRAAIPVDLYGQMPDMDALLARLPSGLPVIEDAAQAILAEHGGRRAGSFGRAGAFSFYPTKNLGGYGDGGMLATNDEQLAERLRRLRVHGSADRYYHDEAGINSRLDTLQAAVLLVKLRHVEGWTVAREQAAARYHRLLAEIGLSCPGLVYPSEKHPVVPPAVTPGPGRRHVFHQYTARVLERDRLRAALENDGIRTAVFYPLPLHLQKCFAHLGGRECDCPEAERASREVLSLPIFPEITEEQQGRVVAAIARFFGRL